MKPTSFAVALCLLPALLSLGGCAGKEDYLVEHEQRVVAPIAGAGVGLAAGSAIGGNIAKGTLAGAGLVMGAAVGPVIERRDTKFFDRAIDEAADGGPGTKASWQNPNTGNKGTIAVVKNVNLFASETCRELLSTVTTKDRITEEQLIVCRDEPGPWYIYESDVIGARPAK